MGGGIFVIKWNFVCGGISVNKWNSADFLDMEFKGSGYPEPSNVSGYPEIFVNYIQNQKPLKLISRSIFEYELWSINFLVINLRCLKYPEHLRLISRRVEIDIQMIFRQKKY